MSSFLNKVKCLINKSNYRPQIIKPNPKLLTALQLSLKKARDFHEIQAPYDTERGGFLKHISAFRSRTGSAGL